MKEIITRVFKCINKKQKKKLFLLQVLSLLSALFNVLSVLMIAPFIALLTNQKIIFESKIFKIFDSLMLMQHDNLVLYYSLVLVFLLVISTLSNLFINYLNLKWSADLQIYFSSTLYNYYINRDLIFHANTSTNDLLGKIHTDTQRLNSTVITPFVELVTNLIFSMFMFLAILLVNFKIAFFLILIFSLSYIFFYLYLSKNLSFVGKKLSSAYPKYFKYLYEGFSSIRDSILFNKITYFKNKFSENVIIINKLMVKEQFITTLPRNIIEILFFAIVISVIYYLIKVLNYDLLSFGPVIAFYAISAIKIIPTLQKIFNSFSSIKVHYSAFNSIEKDLLDAKKEQNNINKFKIEKDLKFTKSIELKDVSFTYPGTKNSGVYDVNVKIPYGSIAGFFGKTGSGKSTIIDLILGFLKPDKGVILVDEINISENIRGWQNNLSYVPQNFFIYDEKLKNNIFFGQDENDFDLNRLKNCLKLSCLEEFLDNLDYNVGERGERVSGGQKQRIAIARSLYKKSEVLFLDEATSALDSITEKKILQNLLVNEKIKTIVLISHRFETLKMCDVLYEVKDGNIKKINNIKELEEKYSNKKLT